MLASASTSRAALLRAAGLRFEALPAAIDEAPLKIALRAAGGSAEDAALALADQKAAAVAALRPDALVIGADQILVAGRHWFDKPDTLAAAAGHLRTLSGSTHRLATAVVLRQGDAVLWHHVVSPRLTMRPLSETFLAAYLAAEGEAVCASVGAYRLEGIGAHLFVAIAGEHAAILGLPLLALLAELRRRRLVLT